MKIAKRRGKINLDITSILLALEENLARIDFDLEFIKVIILRKFIIYLDTNLQQPPRLNIFRPEKVWSSQGLRCHKEHLKLLTLSSVFIFYLSGICLAWLVFPGGWL